MTFFILVFILKYSIPAVHGLWVFFEKPPVMLYQMITFATSIGGIFNAIIYLTVRGEHLWKIKQHAHRKNITGIGMVNISGRQQPHLDGNVSSRQTIGFNERRENHRTTGQAAARPKNSSLYTGTAKELSYIFNQNKYLLNVKTFLLSKTYIHRNEDWIIRTVCINFSKIHVTFVYSNCLSFS